MLRISVVTNALEPKAVAERSRSIAVVEVAIAVGLGSGHLKAMLRNASHKEVNQRQTTIKDLSVLLARYSSYQNLKLG